MSSVAVDQALISPAPEVAGKLLAITEDQWFDRKSVRIAPKDLADHVAGMANAEGGHIVVGLSEGLVEGFSPGDKKMNDLRQAPADFLVPPVRVTTKMVEARRSDGSSTHLMDFDVAPSGSVHVNQKDEAFLRIGDENRRLRYAQRQELEFDKGQSVFEMKVLEEVSYATVDEALAENYREATSHPDAKRLFQARGLAVNEKLTIAGCLLFAANPQKTFPEAFVRVLRYRGDKREAGSRQQLIDDERFEGPIPRQLMNAADAIERLQPTRRALAPSGKFSDIGIVPRDAWLEGLVNAVIHRSYSLSGDHVRVEIFDTRIEVTSPGRFPGIVSVEDPVEAPRFARNPRVARVCSDLNFGQELGEGIRRMYEEMKLAGLELPVYRQTSASVVLTLSGIPVDRDLEARLPNEYRAVSELLRDAGRLSTGEISEALRLSRPVTIRRLRAMEAEGVIEWNGKSSRDPRAYWTLGVRR